MLLLHTSLHSYIPTFIHSLFSCVPKAPLLASLVLLVDCVFLDQQGVHLRAALLISIEDPHLLPTLVVPHKALWRRHYSSNEMFLFLPKELLKKMVTDIPKSKKLNMRNLQLFQLLHKKSLLLFLKQKRIKPSVMDVVTILNGNGRMNFRYVLSMNAR